MIGGLATLLGIAVALAWLYHRQGSHAATEVASESPAQSGEDVVSVKTVRPSPGGILRTSSQVGSVQAYESADLYAKISGYLKTLLVDYGSRVKKGQLLAEIDDPELVKERDRDVASLALARSVVAQAEARVKSAEADARAADAAVDEAKADIHRTASKRSYRSKVLARYRDLVARAAETPQVVDEQEENYESAVADEQSARAAEITALARAAAAHAKVEQARADLAEAKASVDVAAATLAKSEVLVGYMRITSPYDGVVTNRTFFPGAFIRSAAEGGTTPLLTVARTDKVRVITAIPDRDVPYADVGDKAEVRLDALGTEVLDGTVSRFAETEDPTSRTMHTEIDLPNPEGRIRPGMYGIARVILDESQKTSTIPARSLVGEAKDGKGEVFIIRDGKAKKVSFETGADDGLRVEVLSGLKPTDEIIVDAQRVNDGMSVRKLEESNTTAAEVTSRDE